MVNIGALGASDSRFKSAAPDCGCNTMAVSLVSNQIMWVRFPSPAYGSSIWRAGKLMRGVRLPSPAPIQKAPRGGAFQVQERLNII